ncbi:hypothetical protein F52700_7305 [Fusarium sp. NRRL 52700]|nr:hypothetical protein F52700_7305 [Fusarium sp. NRRL 52700]
MNTEERKFMQRSQKAGQYTGFAFLCRGTKIPVHKVIICAQSKVFNAACTSGFREATSGVYDLSEYPLEFVEMMVDYFYVGQYEDPNRDGSKLPLSTHLLMLVLADKYIIQGLVSEAKLSYTRRLKQKDVEMDDFLESLPVLYELPVAVTREFIDAAVAHTRETVLTCTCRNTSMGVIDQISDASQDFLKEVMMSIMSTPLVSRCSDCSKQYRIPVPSAGSLFAPRPGTNAPTTGGLFGSRPGTNANAPASDGLFSLIRSMPSTYTPTTGGLFGNSPGTNVPVIGSLLPNSPIANAPATGSLFGSNSGTNVSSPVSVFTPRP